MIPLRRSLKKSRKHRAIAPAALGGCGGLGQLWEALAELREALGELWEGLEELGGSIYVQTPDQPHQRLLCYNKSNTLSLIQ